MRDHLIQEIGQIEQHIARGDIAIGRAQNSITLMERLGLDSTAASAGLKSFNALQEARFALRRILLSEWYAPRP
jgi:hypothetical protein